MGKAAVAIMTVVLAGLPVGAAPHAAQRSDVLTTCEPPGAAVEAQEAASDVLGRVERVRILSRTQYPEQRITAYEARISVVRLLQGRPVQDRFTHRFSDARTCLGGDLLLQKGDQAVFFFRSGEATPFYVMRPEHYEMSDPGARYPTVDPAAPRL